jgi:hypothetical protein
MTLANRIEIYIEKFWILSDYLVAYLTNLHILTLTQPLLQTNACKAERERRYTLSFDWTV